MTKADFDKKLKSLGLSRQEFCNISGLSYATVASWKDESRAVPSWVEPLLFYYDKARKYDDFQAMISDGLSK